MCCALYAFTASSWPALPLLLFFLGPTLELQLTASLQEAGTYVSTEATRVEMATVE